MKKNILIPTDFSDNAWSALVYALKLFAEETATFYFLNSVRIKVSSMSNISNKLLRTMCDSALKELLELKKMAEVANNNMKHDFKVILSTEDLIIAINESVTKHNVDMIVMGTQGASGVKELLFGTNTVKVINQVKKCPVLVIPDDYNFVIPEQIAFPTDFKRFYDDKEINPLKELATLYNSKIKVLNIKTEKQLNEIQQYNLTMLKEYLEDFSCSFHIMPDYTKKAKEINVFIEDIKIDILVMVNYKHSLIDHIIKEPVIKKIGFHPKVPFLVIPS
ncbi:universal stress protein [Yeosuana sp. MJ-SS3]|uniref:Universal stress protein n=1 Tax=Gilvirhabdus luticola TaxID=3079858 RepID=A0ABU3U5U1_9FLAO|nr:universal stress protein [Yeosuana sp. MJ-SS3]MDU8885701.1 universal stress protein [Yeosuana sp. MJ-SS3]